MKTEIRWPRNHYSRVPCRLHHDEAARLKSVLVIAGTGLVPSLLATPV